MQDGEKVGSRAEKKAGAGGGGALHGKSLLLRVIGRQERLRHITTAGSMHFVDHAGCNMEDRFEGFKPSTGQTS